MLNFRTLLLSLAFIFLVGQEFIFFNNSSIGLAFRLIPTALLIVWFVLSIFGPQKYKIQVTLSNKRIILALKFLRPLANLSIILGAVLKLLHLNYGNYFLTAGIGFLAIWSLLFSFVANNIDNYNPEIIDDIELDEEEVK